jgi:cytochrome c peroxidase
MAKLHLRGAGIAASFMVLLTGAAAEEAGLLKQAQEIFQPLPKDMATAEFPITKERVELGRSLFFDPRLTIDANMSCSSCHQPAFYGTDALPKPIGVKQRPHPRHVPTNLNSGTSFVIHWRGDRINLADQVFQALHLADHIRSARREGGHRSPGTYPGLRPAVQGGIPGRTATDDVAEHRQGGRRL